MGDFTILGNTSGGTGGEADGVPTRATRRSLGPGANQAAPGDRVPGVFPTARTAAGINAAVEGLTAPKSLELIGDYAISAAASVPLGVHVAARAGTTLTKTSAGTLYFPSFEAPPVQVFFGFSPGDVRFGPNVRAIHPEWWGAKADWNQSLMTGTDCTAAFRCAIAAIPVDAAVPGPEILLGVGGYRITGTIDCSVPAASGFWKRIGAHFRGAGIDSSKIIVHANTTTDGLTYECPQTSGTGLDYGFGGSLRDLSIYGARNDWQSARTLLKIIRWAEFTRENITVSNAWTHVVEEYGNLFLDSQNCHFIGCGGDAVVVGRDQSKNLLRSSNDFTGSGAGLYWTKSYSSVAPVVTPVGAIGEQSAATQVDFPAISSTSHSSILRNVLAPLHVEGPSVQVDFSLYARAVSGTGTLYIFFSDSSGIHAGAFAECSLTETWQRFHVTTALPKSGDWNCTLGPDGTALRGMPSTQPALSCYIAKAQMEYGSTPTTWVDNVGILWGSTSRFGKCSFGSCTGRGLLVKYGQTDVTLNDPTLEGCGINTLVAALECWEGDINIDGVAYFEVNRGLDALFKNPSGMSELGLQVNFAHPALHIPHGGPTHGGLYFGPVKGSVLHGGSFGGGAITYPVVVEEYAELRILAYPSKRGGADASFPPVVADSLASRIVGMPAEDPFDTGPVAVTIAQAAAGLTLIASGSVPAEKQLFVETLDVAVIGATAWSGDFTLLRLEDLAGSPVAIAEVAKAGLTGSAVLPSHSSSITWMAARVQGATAATGIRLVSDAAIAAGSDLVVRVRGHIR